MRVGGAFDEALQQWLNRHWHGVESVRLEGGTDRPKGSGYSATTLIMPVSYSRHGRRNQDRVVVRIESSEPPVYPQQTDHFAVEIELQYRAIEVLSGRPGIPVAPLIGFEDDPGVLGAPFFVMSFIEGQVPIEDPNYTVEGFFTEMEPQQRCRMVNNGLEVLANIHRLDWQQAGVEWLVEGNPGIDKQLEIWRQFTERELKGRTHPPLQSAYKWLLANIPEEQSLALSWGDARLGNIIWQDCSCACVCDFENFAVAPPALDVGYWLMFDRFAHEGQGVARLQGEPTRDEQQAHYEHCSGQYLGNLYFYELFAAARFAAMVVRVTNRSMARGEEPPDQTIWLENPVADMLADMLEQRHE